MGRERRTGAPATAAAPKATAAAARPNYPSKKSTLAPREVRPEGHCAAQGRSRRISLSPAASLSRPNKPYVEISGDDVAWLVARGVLVLDARRTKDYEVVTSPARALPRLGRATSTPA